MNSHNSRRVGSLIAFNVVIWFCLTIVGGGHGIGPMVIFIANGFPGCHGKGILGIATATAVVLVLISSLIPRPLLGLTVAVLGMLALAGVVLWVSTCDHHWMAAGLSLITSTPFVLACYAYSRFIYAKRA